MKEKDLRAELLADPRVLRVRIKRDGAVDVMTDAPRGDGGRVPYWLFKGWKEELLREREAEDEKKTAVVFRTWRDDGTVIALFPLLVENSGHCGSYEHVGQHGAASYRHVISKTRPATAEEYGDLKTELERIGYKLDVRKRIPARNRRA